MIPHRFPIVKNPINYCNKRINSNVWGIKSQHIKTPPKSGGRTRGWRKNSPYNKINKLHLYYGEIMGNMRGKTWGNTSKNNDFNTVLVETIKQYCII